MTSVVLAHISKATMHSLEYLFCAMNCGDQREDVPDLVSSCKESTLWQGTRCVRASCGVGRMHSGGGSIP